MAKPYTDSERDTLKAEFLDLFNKTHGAVYLTCKKMGIPVQTFHQWKCADEKFKLAIEEVRELTKDYLEINLVRDAIKKGGTDRIFYMKCQMKDRGYIEREREDYKDPMRIVMEYKANEADEDYRARVIAEYEASKQLENKPDENIEQP